MNDFQEKFENAKNIQNNLNSRLALINLFKEVVLYGNSPEEINEKCGEIEKAFLALCKFHVKPYSKNFQIIFNERLKGTTYYLNDEHILLMEEKYGDRYLKVSDLKNFREKIIKIVNERFEENFYLKNEDQYDYLLNEKHVYSDLPILFKNNLFEDYVKKTYSWNATSENKIEILNMLVYCFSDRNFFENENNGKHIANAIEYVGKLYSGYYFWKGLFLKFKNYYSEDEADKMKLNCNDIYKTLLKLTEVPKSILLKDFLEKENEKPYSKLYNIINILLNDECRKASFVSLE